MVGKVFQQLAALQVGSLEPMEDERATPPSSDLQTTYRCIYIIHRTVKICQLRPVMDDLALYCSAYRNYLAKLWESKARWLSFCMPPHL